MDTLPAESSTLRLFSAAVSELVENRDGFHRNKLFVGQCLEEWVSCIPPLKELAAENKSFRDHALAVVELVGGNQISPNTPCVWIFFRVNICRFGQGRS